MPDAPPLGELLMRAARTLRRRWTDVLEPLGLSPHQARALRAIGAADGVRVSDLARALRIAPRSATEVVDALAARRLVERTADPGDRRVVVVSLTGHGRAAAAHVEQARADDAEELFARLDEHDRATLARILAQLDDDPHVTTAGESSGDAPPDSTSGADRGDHGGTIRASQRPGT